MALFAHVSSDERTGEVEPDSAALVGRWLIRIGQPCSSDATRGTRILEYE